MDDESVQEHVNRYDNYQMLIEKKKELIKEFKDAKKNF